MDGPNKSDFSKEVEIECKGETEQKDAHAAWETPKMEDVSEQVMAQPYIRFT